MADAKISALTAAVALTGTEKVPVVQGSDTVRTTAQAIANLASGAPGAPVNAVQFNNPLGTFAGDADFTWVSGLGLTIGGATETLGVVTPGVGGEHVAIGNYALIDNPVFDPGVANLIIPAKTTVVICDYIVGDLSGGAPAALRITNAFAHTGGPAKSSPAVLDFEPSISANSTGPIGSLLWFFVAGSNSGSGHIDTWVDIYLFPFNGGGSIGTYNGIAIDPSILNFGGAIATAIGLSIGDCSGIGTTASENIHSAGANSINTFEGTITVQDRLVAALPTAGVKGRRSTVSDATQALTAGIGAIVAGTGGNTVPVFDDGTNWRIG